MSHHQRPLSPHLQVYRLPMLAVISFTHRATGVFLSVAALIIPLLLITLACGEDAYLQLQTYLSAWYGKAFLFALSLAMCFHLLNGIRHLFWDAGLNLDVSGAEKSGIVVIALSLILTTSIWLLACGIVGGTV